VLFRINSTLFLVVLLTALPAGTAFAQIDFTEHDVGQLAEATSVYAVDLDTDGDIDILGSAYEGQQIAWWSNDGEQDFTFDVIAVGFNGAIAVHTADFNGDGNLDIVAGATNASSIRWWEGDGEGNFNEHVITNNFRTVRAVYPVDLDSDGDIDVIGASYSGNIINWWSNDGNGNFNERSVGANYARANSVFTSDVDGDGDVDVISGSGWGEQVAVWWENNGNEQFQRNNLNGGAASVVFAEDIDSDGDIDIFGGAQYSDAMYWWENNGEEDPAFQVHLISDNVNDPAGLFVADLDDDGDNDLLGAIWAEGTFKYWENEGNEQFREFLISDDLNGACSIRAIDLDQDGDLDIVGAARGNSDRIIWWESPLAEDEPDPPASVDLISPVNDSILVELTVQLIWTRVNSQDEEIEITYQAQWSTSEDFADFMEQDVNSDTLCFVEGLTDDSEYWWRVQATNPESGLTSMSNQIWHFLTAMPEPPGEFNLLTPENGAVISVEESSDVQISWEPSVDPDPNDTLIYNLYIQIEGIREPLIWRYLNRTESEISVNFPGNLNRAGIEFWEDNLPVTWHVEAISGVDTVFCLSPFAFQIEAHSKVGDGQPVSVPSKFRILSVYPNPFNSSTDVQYELPFATQVSMSIFDLTGSKVLTLLDHWKKAGVHDISLSASTLPVGLYILRIQSEDVSKIRKIAVVK